MGNSSLRKYTFCAAPQRRTRFSFPDPRNRYTKPNINLMKIAILGTRGIPANYGGFETFAEHLSTRLVSRRHDVTVYCRAHYVSPRQIEFQGVRLKVLPTIRHKYLDTVVHSFLSALHAMPVRYDAALICNA